MRVCVCVCVYAQGVFSLLTLSTEVGSPSQRFVVPCLQEVQEEEWEEEEQEEDDAEACQNTNQLAAGIW